MHNVTGFICVRFNISFAVNYFRDNYIRFSGFHFIFRLNLTEQRGAKTFHSAFKILIIVKLREREGQGVDPGRSLKGHLWMVDGGWWISFP